MRYRLLLSLLILCMGFSFVGCPCTNSIVNSSPSFRWWLFSKFAADRICPEMTKHGVPIRQNEKASVMGRFYPTGCSIAIDDPNKTMGLSISGSGYVFTQATKRIGFTFSTTVEYRPDFQIDGDYVYVWGKFNRIVQPPNFQLGFVENRLVDLATNIPPFDNMTSFLANQFISASLTKGFTVVNHDKENLFGLGTIMPPDKPKRTFDIQDKEKITVANEMTDVHSNQRDYIGPFEISKSGQALFLNISLDGPPVDVMIVDRTTGDKWREAYQAGWPLGPPPGPVIAGGPLNPGPMELRKYNLLPAMYYVVIDHSSASGIVNPPQTLPMLPLMDSVARIGLVAQVGE